MFKFQLWTQSENHPNLVSNQLFLLDFNIVSGKTVSFVVDTNGRKVDDISVLALDASPDVNENLFMIGDNDLEITHGDQSFSKTFSFNQSIDKYLIVVRSVSGMTTSTNFNV